MTFDANVDRIIQDIGQAAIHEVVCDHNNILLYAEVDGDRISADLFYQIENGSIQFRFCEKTLVELILEFWKISTEKRLMPPWRVLCYRIEGTSIHLDFTYPDQIYETEDEFDRRTRAVTRYFGAKAIVNYPRRDT